MRRGEPPQRRTPLEAKKPLRRGKSLERGKGLVRRVPSRTPAGEGDNTRRRRQSGPSRMVRRLVDCRAAGGDCDLPSWCEWPGCNHLGQDRHHRLNRKDGGRHGAMAEVVNGVAWLLKVCRVHHRQVTSAHGAALADARASGWLLMEGQVAEEVPVLTRHWPSPVLLDGCGAWTAM